MDKKKKTNHKDLSIKNFWWSADAEWYSHISSNWLYSDIPAYLFTYDLMNLRGKIVLDYGCYRGDSSLKLLQGGAKEVVGVDIVQEFIHKAKELYKDHTNLSFKHINSDENRTNIPKAVYGLYDSVVATFVHPTINSRETLSTMFRSIQQVLKEGGSLFLLGLHPDSFNPRNNYISYRHHLKNGHAYISGTPFPNELVTNKGIDEGKDMSLKFFDYCWTEETLRDLAKECDFKSVRTVNLTMDLEGHEGMLLRNIIRNVESKFKEKGLDYHNSDEFIAPLHQLFIFTK